MKKLILATLILVLSAGSVIGQLGWRLRDRMRPRSGTSMAHDSTRGETVLFGGYAGYHALDDTWKWDGATWVRCAPAGIVPARYDHAMAYDAARDRVVLFGGQGRASFNSLNDTWIWDGAGWTQCQVGVSPSQRAEHAMAYDASRGRVVLFGGRNRRHVPLGDTWEWDGGRWIACSPTRSPPAGRGHSLAYDPIRKRVVLSGGSDVWEWDGKNWSNVTPAPQNPMPPTGTHPLAYDPANRQVLLLDRTRTWHWNGKGWRKGNPYPTGMTYNYGFPATLVSDMRRRRVVFHAGEDTWEWDGGCWQRAAPADCASWGWVSAMAYDPVRGRTVLFNDDETWEWDGTDWARWRHPCPISGWSWVQAAPAIEFDVGRQRMLLFGGGVHGTSSTIPMDGTFEWTAGSWKNCKPLRKPPPRYSHRMVCDPIRRRVVLFGGWGGTGYFQHGLLNDTWEWDGNNWNDVTPRTSPGGREGFGMAYDIARRRVVLFGGSDTNRVFSDTWEWDGATWSYCPAKVTPPARAWHAMTYDAARQRVVLFGGHDGKNDLGDLWEWDGRTWSRSVLSQGAGAPCARYGHAMAHDLARGCTVLVGGAFSSATGYRFHDDTWEYAPHDLTSSVHAVSVSRGGVVKLRLDAGAKLGSRPYLVLGCMDRLQHRSIRVGVVDLPLSPDAYFFGTALCPNTAIRDSFGVLDASGKAEAVINLRAGLPAALIGCRFYHAYLVFGSNRFVYASSPVPLTLSR